MAPRSDITYFGAGPAALPTEVIEDAAQAFVNYRDTGLGIAEHSHRSALAANIINETKADLASYLDIPDDPDQEFLSYLLRRLEEPRHNWYYRCGYQQKLPTAYNISASCGSNETAGVYIAGQVLKKLLLQHPKVQGQAVEAHPEIYKIIPGKAVRSRMNICFRIEGGDPAEEAFLEEAAALGLTGLRGHRSLGGIRASNYNSISVDGAEKLAKFIGTFASQRGTSIKS
ncbi:hypothetical protein F4823DRAFT_557541 [Ustulina deusta]|nr:hypothetical protein F4823DRAFT_557541 [Ustulina deusta]